MYNRYHGNSGYVERVEDAGPRQPAPPSAPPPGQRRPPGPMRGLSGEIGRLLVQLSPSRLETEDWLALVLLYLLYRESGDREFLYAAAAYLLL